MTLREAITSINNGAAANADVIAVGAFGTNDRIEFNIVGAGVQTIVLATNLPEISKPVVIDGYTQPGASPNTNGPGLGTNAVLRIQLTDSWHPGSTGLRITGGGSTVRGLVINGGFEAGIDLQTVGDNTIAGNFIGTTFDGSLRGPQFDFSRNAVLLQSSNNTIGGTAPGDRNLLAAPSSGVHVPARAIADASNNVIKGNFIGIDAAGMNGFRGNVGGGISIESGSGNQIGGNIPGAGNLITGLKGIAIFLGGPTPASSIRNSNGGHIIQGNLIGTDLTGAALLNFTNSGNRPSQGIEQDGIFIIGLLHPDPTINPLPITIGGAAASAGNVIAGSLTGAGIELQYPSGFNAATSILGNFIGTDRTGVRNFGNAGGGINLRSIRDVTITGNTIAFNGERFNSAVTTPSGETGILIVDNSIHGNGDGNPGIIRAPGVGPAPPTLTSVTVAGSITTVQGTVSGTAGSVVRVDLYANAPTTPPITVQGQTPARNLQVAIGPSGTATFTTSFPTVPAQPLITATATSPANTTSPFSAPAATSSGPEFEADLVTSSSVAPDPVSAGGLLTYELGVRNLGLRWAEDVLLSFAMPSGATFVQALAPLGWTITAPPVGGTGILTFSHPFLTDGFQSPSEFTVVVRVGDAIPGGTILSSTTTVSAETEDPDTSNNASVATTRVAFVAPPTTDLGVGINATPLVITVGQSVFYTLAVTNLTETTATNVVLFSQLPSGAVFVSSSAGSFNPATNTFTANLGTIEDGAPVTLTLVLRPSMAGPLTYVVDVSGDLDDDNLANNHASVTTAVQAASTDTTGPRVVRLQRFGYHCQPTVLVLTFNEALDPIRARNPANYRLVGPSGWNIPIASVSYNATTKTVTLRPSRLLALRYTYFLSVKGNGPGGLTDLAGNLLDGNRDGQPGGHYTASITRGSLAGPSVGFSGAFGVPLPAGPVVFGFFSMPRHRLPS